MLLVFPWLRNNSTSMSTSVRLRTYFVMCFSYSCEHSLDIFIFRDYFHIQFALQLLLTLNTELFYETNVEIR